MNASFASSSVGPAASTRLSAIAAACASLLAFACFDLGDGGLDQPGALGVGEHSVDDAMLAGIELARAKIARHAGEHHFGRRIHVKRWSSFEGRVRFYRVAVAINPDVIARAVSKWKVPPTGGSSAPQQPFGRTNGAGGLAHARSFEIRCTVPAQTPSLMSLTTLWRCRSLLGLPFIAAARLRESGPRRAGWSFSRS